MRLPCLCSTSNSTRIGSNLLALVVLTSAMINFVSFHQLEGFHVVASFYHQLEHQHIAYPSTSFVVEDLVHRPKHHCTIVLSTFFEVVGLLQVFQPCFSTIAFIWFMAAWNPLIIPSKPCLVIGMLLVAVLEKMDSCWNIHRRIGISLPMILICIRGLNLLLRVVFGMNHLDFAISSMNKI